MAQKEVKAFRKQSTPEWVTQQLRDLVTGPTLSVGDRLVSMRTLSQRLGSSLPTVQRALDLLQAEGLVEKRHGSGVYVTGQHAPIAMTQCVTLCAGGYGHVWGELAHLFLVSLQQHHLAVTLVSQESTTDGDQLGQRLLSSLYNSPSPCMIVRGSPHFPFETLKTLGQRRRSIVGIVDWESSYMPPGLVRVLSDARLGGKMVAEHLLKLGHRHVVVVGTPTQLIGFHDKHPNNLTAAGFKTAWEAAGGKIDLCTGHSHGPEAIIRLETDNLKKIFAGKDAPTAGFGLMDIAACDLSWQLSKIDPVHADRMAYVGYFNTPWSQAAQPPMTSVDLDLQAIVDKTWPAVDAAVKGKRPPFELAMIKPKLVVRQTSRKVFKRA